LILLVVAVAFTFVTVWALIFLYSPMNRVTEVESRRYSTDVSKSLTSLRGNSETTVRIPSLKEEYTVAEPLG
jgi:hypothetical protein